jgi:hypothetical protein
MISLSEQNTSIDNCNKKIQRFLHFLSGLNCWKFSVKYKNVI